MTPFLFAPSHVARAQAPGTFPELMRWASEGGLIMPVWEGASHGTIWGSPQANHAFRAWHDSFHIRAGLPFTLEGEREAARLQCQEAERAGQGRMCPVIWQDVAGQAEYFAQHGVFPHDQGAFHAGL